jgi:signal transduction histidine kinase
LLALAVSERYPAEVEFVDLATVVEDALDDAQELIRGRRIHVTTSLDAAPLSGDHTLLERLAGNLVENAVRHNVDEGWIEVRTCTELDRAYLEISNSGQVIEPDLTESLFEPFRRAGERTSNARGVGLGLAIVRAIVTSHGGAVTACSRAEGGLTLSVSLPGTTSPAGQAHRSA